MTYETPGKLNQRKIMTPAVIAKDKQNLTIDEQKNNEISKQAYQDTDKNEEPKALDPQRSA